MYVSVVLPFGSWWLVVPLVKQVLQGFGTGLCPYQPSDLGLLWRRLDRTSIRMCQVAIGLSSTSIITKFVGPVLCLVA